MSGVGGWLGGPSTLADAIGNQCRYDSASRSGQRPLNYVIRLRNSECGYRTDSVQSKMFQCHLEYTHGLHGLWYMGYLMVHGIMVHAASSELEHGFYSAVSEVARRASRGTVRLGIVRGRESLRTLSGEKSLRLVAPGTRAVAVGSALSPLLHSVRQTGH